MPHRQPPRKDGGGTGANKAHRQAEERRRADAAAKQAREARERAAAQKRAAEEAAKRAAAQRRKNS